MIIWPNPALHSLTPAARRGFVHLQASGAAAELEASPATWTVVSWPWNDEAPLRIVLEDEAHHALEFLEDDGVWRFHPLPQEVHRRSPSALRQEAWGEPPLK